MNWTVFAYLLFFAIPIILVLFGIIEMAQEAWRIGWKMFLPFAASVIGILTIIYVTTRG